MGYDLHVHSIYSDGTLKPSELVTKACAKRLSGIAITDHDTVAGVEEGLKAADLREIVMIPGIELTTDWDIAEVHILGYNFNYKDALLKGKLDLIIEARNERARQILKKLSKNRISLSWDKVKAQTTSKFIGRTHIFRALEAAGQIDPGHRKNAFDYYLGKDGIAFVPHQEINTLEAINLINQTGGLSVLAHPGRMGDDELIKRLVDAGLQGIEVFYPSHTPEMVDQYLKVAQNYHLVVTGGSDYHGAFSQSKLGQALVEEIPWFEGITRCSSMI